MRKKLAITIAVQNVITCDALPMCYIVNAEVPDNVAESMEKGELMSITMVKETPSE